ncbi:MAG TPA: hypothetical protein VNQ15_02630, partial [Verrucomicrobiae bacterium]|nr:hypothetical protein [Verrucomicrobiae bacterium]
VAFADFETDRENAALELTRGGKVAIRLDPWERRVQRFRACCVLRTDVSEGNEQQGDGASDTGTPHTPETAAMDQVRFPPELR